MEEKGDLELLKKFKKVSGWSYQKLASHLGIHYQTIIAWFLDQTYPSPMARDRIRKFLRSIERSKQKYEARK
ncbi:hypothetical protein ES705_12926 [subsurface metagenome]